MAKKAAAKKTRKKPERTKGGFGVYLQETNSIGTDGSGKDVSLESSILREIVSGLKDTQDAIKWVKENAEKHEGKTLVIAQVKQTITCTVKKMVVVQIEEV